MRSIALTSEQDSCPSLVLTVGGVAPMPGYLLTFSGGISKDREMRSFRHRSRRFPVIPAPMTNLLTGLFPSDFRQPWQHLSGVRVTRVFWKGVCVIATPVILAGCASSSVPNAEPTISPVSGESISTEEVENYARAVLAIEPSREAAYSEILQEVNDEQKVARVACTQPETIAALPGDVQEIATNYCQRAKQIGESNGLTMTQFNTITASAQADPELQQRLQNELIRLQR